MKDKNEFKGQQNAFNDAQSINDNQMPENGTEDLRDNSEGGKNKNSSIQLQNNQNMQQTADGNESQGKIPDAFARQQSAFISQNQRKKNITDEDIKRAYTILQQYQQEKQAISQRIIENEQYYEFTSTAGRPRKQIFGQDGRPKTFKQSHSAYLFNAIANKHADFMDNEPSPTILPQEASDEETAKILSDVVPCIFDLNDFTDLYSQVSFDKLVAGAGLYAVIWDGSADNGLGQIKINAAEILNLYWKGGIKRLEDSPNLFYVSIENNAELELRYPELQGRLGNGTVSLMNEYIYEDMPNKEQMSMVVDWYYKKAVLQENAVGQQVLKYQLHYCCFCNGIVLYASENEYDPETGEPMYPNGFYEHGKYPYVMDTMFPLKGSPAGFGYVDITKNPQDYIDELDTATMKNAMYHASPRYIAPQGAGINNRDLEDLNKFVIPVTGLTDQVKPLEVPDLPSILLSVRQMKTDELKETSGNTDFTQGTTSSGVTAASAIAALQEAGSKLSRDMIKNSYTVYAELCRLVIELMRQFYTTDRVFRITQENEQYAYQTVSNKLLKGEPVRSSFGQMIGGRKPYFDIKVSAQKTSPFSRAAQNELAKELYSAGMFNAQIADQAIIALKMMNFEGKDEIVSKVSENQQLLTENNQLKAYLVQLAQVLAQSGDESSAALAQQISAKYSGDNTAVTGTAGQTNAKNVETDSLGNAQSTDTKVDRAKKATQDRTEVQS